VFSDVAKENKRLHRRTAGLRKANGIFRLDMHTPAEVEAAYYAEAEPDHPVSAEQRNG